MTKENSVVDQGERCSLHDRLDLSLWTLQPLCHGTRFSRWGQDDLIWLDVTSIRRWHQRPVGIIRVELECARYALQNSDQAIRFCAVAGDGWIEVSSEEVECRIEGIASKRRATNAEHTHNATTVWPSGVGAVIRKAAQLVRSGLNQSRLAPAGPNRAGGAHQDIMPFRQGDTYLSIGLDWDDKCQGRIDSLKSRYGLYIARMCYDLIPIKFPNLAHPSAVRAMSNGYLEKLCSSADVVLSISNRTRIDLAAYLEGKGEAIPRLEVVELGGELISKGNGSLPEPLLDATFILYVSTIERRKNHAVIIKAYRDLIDRDLATALPQLVFVGMRGWGVSDLMNDIANDPQMADRVLFLNDLEDDVLAALYDACLFTVFPSQYEGWGLGISESLAHGKFCIASNAGALTEAGKDLVDYVNPLDWQQWSNLLLHHIQDRNGLERRQRDISTRYKPVPWGECARQIFALVDDASSAISAKSTPTGRT